MHNHVHKFNHSYYLHNKLEEGELKEKGGKVGFWNDPFCLMARIRTSVNKCLQVTRFTAIKCYMDSESQCGKLRRSLKLFSTRSSIVGALQQRLLYHDLIVPARNLIVEVVND